MRKVTAVLLLVLTLTLTTFGAPPPLSALHEEARNATFKNSGCGKPDLCSSHRGDGLLSPGRLAPHRFALLPCFCDVPECREFGDCCVDLVAASWSLPRPDTIQGLPANSWRCQHFADIRTKTNDNKETLLRVPQSAWMVSECPGDVDPEVARQCAAQHDQLGSEYTYMHDVPVIANGSLFRNLFCAACFGHGLSDLMALNFELHCSDNTTEKHQLRADRYVAGEGRWELEDGANCTLEVREYANMTVLNAGLAAQGWPEVRQCRPSVDRCPPGWSDADVAAKCAAYSLAVIDVDNITVNYKNPHCALCHGVSTVKCNMASKSGARTSGTPGSLSLIFHFSLGGDVVGQRACSPGFVWDALYLQCRPVFSCEAGTRYKAGQCPDMGRSLTTGQLNDSSCDRLVLDSHEFQLLDNGSMLLNRSKEVLDPTMYLIVEDDKVEVCAKDVAVDLSDSGAGSEFSELQGLLTLVCTCVSLLGLALHVIVLLALPRLRNLPGLISMATSLALFAAQALFLWGTSAHRPSAYTSCVLLAALLHFCFLQVFAWTSVMSYDIWRTFSHPTGHMSGRRSNSRRTQFAKYVVFASTVPAAIVACSLSLDIINTSLPISPEYAQSSFCWFGSRTGLALFFGAPVCAMLVCNLVMYGIVVIHIREQRQASRFLVELGHRGEQAGQVKPNQASPRYTENDCKLHFSIFNVMGGTWILGLIAGVINLPVLWYLFIILNGSQGALIFILQIMKPRVWDMIRNRMHGIVEESSSRNTPSTLITSSLKSNGSSLIKK